MLTHFKRASRAYLNPINMLGFLAACLCIRLVEKIVILNDRFLWIDEYTSLWTIDAGLSAVAIRTASGQGNSPLYYYILYFWRTLTSDQPFALRSLNLFSSLAAALITSLRVRRLVSGTLIKKCIASTAAAMFLILSCEFVYASTNLRAYSFVLLFFSLSGFFLDDYIRSRSFFSGSLFWSFALLCYLSHPTGLFALSGQIAVAFFLSTPTLFFWGCGIVTMASGVLQSFLQMQAHIQNLTDIHGNIPSIFDLLTSSSVVLVTTLIFLILTVNMLEGKWSFTRSFKLRVMLECGIPIVALSLFVLWARNSEIFRIYYHTAMIVSVANYLAVCGSNAFENPDLKLSVVLPFLLLLTRLLDPMFPAALSPCHTELCLSGTASPSENWNQALKTALVAKSEDKRIIIDSGLSQQRYQKFRFNPNLTSLFLFPVHYHKLDAAFTELVVAAPRAVCASQVKTLCGNNFFLLHHLGWPLACPELLENAEKYTNQIFNDTVLTRFNMPCH